MGSWSVVPLSFCAKISPKSHACQDQKTVRIIVLSARMIGKQNAARATEVLLTKKEWLANEGALVYGEISSEVRPFFTVLACVRACACVSFVAASLPQRSSAGLETIEAV